MSEIVKKAVLEVDGKRIELPIIEGKIGPAVIDVGDLYKQTKYFTYDPGFMSTASCESRITYIDGDAGILKHCGYKIEDLAEKSNFMEVCYLLLNNKLPTSEEYNIFIQEVNNHRLVDEQLQFMVRSFQRRSHPMAIMVGAVASLSAFYHDSLDIYDESQRKLSAYRIIAKMPTLAAMAYKYSIGQPFIFPAHM